MAELRAHGATHLILARVLEDRAELDRYRVAVPGADITVCRLRAPEELRLERLRQRMPPGASRDWHRRRTVELDQTLDRQAVEDYTVANDDRPVRRVALDVLIGAGWVSTETASSLPPCSASA